MKAVLWFCLATFVALTARGAWQDELVTTPGAFPPFRPFHAHYKFGWKMFTAAEADVDFQQTRLGVAQLSATARSIGVVRNMWRMDAQHFATMDPATLRPLALSQTEMYKGETITTKLLFTPEGLDRTRLSTIPSDKQGKVKHFKIPQTFDLHAAVQFLRSQALPNGDLRKVVVYPGAAGFLAQVNVIDRPRLRVGSQTWNSIRLDLKLWRIAKDLSLEPHEKFKRATIWLSDDPDRILLRIECELHIGSVWCELDHLDWK